MNSGPLDLAMAHAVVAPVLAARGRRPVLVEWTSTNVVAVPWAAPGAFEGASIDLSTSTDADLFRMGGRLWRPIRHPDGSGRDLDLDAAVLAMGRPGGLGGAPAAAAIPSVLRGRPMPGAPPAGPVTRAAEAAAAAAVVAHAARDLVHDGTRLYRAVEGPLVMPRAMPGVAEPSGWDPSDPPGVLPSRIGLSGVFPHLGPNRDRVYDGNVQWIGIHLARSLDGIALGDADVVAFVNDVPGPLLAAVRACGGDPSTLDAHDAALLPLAASGALRATRDDRMSPTVDALRSAAAFVSAHGGGRRARWAASIVAFADLVARPALDVVYPVDPDDVAALDGMAP